MNNVETETETETETQNNFGVEGVAPEFFVVGVPKFLLMCVFTLGLYTVYWFYQNFKLQKAKHSIDSWPIARSIFNIFFVHSLFESIEKSLQRKEINFEWSYKELATFYVVTILASRIFSQLYTYKVFPPYTEIVALSLIPVIAYLLTKAQKAINVYEGDPEGNSNADFSATNYIFLVLGCIWWALIIFGLVALTN